MKFKLHTLFPKQKLIGVGTLCIGKEKDAQFFEGDAGHDDRVLAQLDSVQIGTATSDGITMGGFEKKPGNNYAYQEWFLAYIEDDK
jgi:hypothetical protein